MTELPDLDIDRTSPVPFYFQLAEALEQEIVERPLGTGRRVPSEPELGDRFRLSRTTIRQALGRLEQRGLINRVRARGRSCSGPSPASGCCSPPRASSRRRSTVSAAP